MYDYTDTLWFKLRYLIGFLFVALCLLLLPFLLSLIWINPTASAANSHSSENTDSSATYDSPNLVANGLFSAADGIGKGVNKTQKSFSKSINSATATIATATVTTGRAVAKGATASAGAVASAVGTSSSFVADTTGNIIGFVADAPVVTSIIRPADSLPPPAIDPDIPILAVAQAEPPKNDSADVPAEAAEPEAKPIWPIHGAITTEFGVPHWPFQPTHTGIDISDGKPSGITPIHAFKPGVVKEVIQSSLGFGNHVIVDHGNGLTSLYGHMYKTSVKVGQKVDQKTILGYEGTTGASTGPHVHFEIHLNGVPVDPHKYVSGRP
jgi:murein DD-endopeptidase MepM/ murein hydrolase activator NlpD